MAFYVIFDPANGRIRRTGVAPEELIALQANGARWAITDALYSDETHYVDDVNLGTVAERPVLPIDFAGSNIVPPDGATPVVFSGVPDGTAFVIKGAGNPGLFGVVVDRSGVLEVTFDRPATYEITFEQWPYQVKAFKAQAVTP